LSSINSSSDGQTRRNAKASASCISFGIAPCPDTGTPLIEDYDGQTVYIDKIDKASTDVEEYMNRVYSKLKGIGANSIVDFVWKRV
jgi:hypothetical protein